MVRFLFFSSLALSVTLRAEVRVTAGGTGTVSVENSSSSPEPTPAAPVRSATVLAVGSKNDSLVISQNPQKRWKLGDEVCVNRDRKKVTCGKVIMTTEKDATVELHDEPLAKGRRKRDRKKPHRAAAKAGDVVVLAAETPERPPPQNLNITVNVTNPQAPGSDAEKRAPAESRVSLRETEKTSSRGAAVLVGLGAGAGFDYSFPAAVFQMAVSSRVALGIYPLFLSSNSNGITRTAYGGLFTTCVYFGDHPFEGFFGEVGGGAYGLSATVGNSKQTGTEVAALLVGGWHARLPALPLVVGGALGLQYVTRAPSVDLVSFSGLLPLFRAEVGYVF